jgi:hypothetical protein
MRVQSNGLIGFGIEQFEGDIQSIKLDCHHVDGVAGDTIHGFLQKREGKVETLITKPFYYGDNDKLLLTTLGGKVPVVPGQIIECTDSFMSFRVRFDSDVVVVSEDDSKQRSKVDDIFNNIWDDL